MPPIPPIFKQHLPLPQLPTNPLLQRPIRTPALTVHLNRPEIAVALLNTVLVPSAPVALARLDVRAEAAVAQDAAIAVAQRQGHVRVHREVCRERGVEDGALWGREGGVTGWQAEAQVGFF